MQSRRGFHGGDTSIDRGEPGDRGAQSEVDARGAHRVRDTGGDVGVEHGAHRRVEPFDHRHVKAALEQALGDLQSDVAGADHHGAAGARAQPSLHLRRIVEGPKLQHTLRIDAGPRGCRMPEAPVAMRSSS